MKLIYLHGFASGPTSTKARYFKQRFEEIRVQLAVPDLCSGNFEAMTITGMLGVIRDVAGSETLGLIGSSLGGYLAALYASRYPEQVARLILMAPGFEFPQRWPQELGAERLAAWKESGKLAVFHYGDKCERNLGYQLVEDAQQYEAMPDFHQPCLIYHGTGDDVVPSRVSVEYAATHPNVELRLVESGHELTDVLYEMWEGSRAFFGLDKSVEEPYSSIG